jgi:hypothetical protein
MVYCAPLSNQPIGANFIAFTRSCKEWCLVVVVQSIHCQATFLKYLAKKFRRTLVERSASRSKHKTLPVLVDLLRVRSASRLQSFRFGTCLKVCEGIFLPPHGGQVPSYNASGCAISRAGLIVINILSKACVRWSVNLI